MVNPIGLWTYYHTLVQQLSSVYNQLTQIQARWDFYLVQQLSSEIKLRICTTLGTTIYPNGTLMESARLNITGWNPKHKYNSGQIQLDRRQLSYRLGQSCDFGWKMATKGWMCRVDWELWDSHRSSGHAWMLV